jgi:putative oxidoreductase
LTTSPHTLVQRHYSPVALRNLAKFFASQSFPAKPRRDTNQAAEDSEGTFMNEAIATWTSRLLSVLRIITGLMIIQHGMAKIIGFPADPSVANFQPASLLWIAGFIELIGGALLILGLWTQPAAFLVAGEMGVGYLIAHAPKSFFPLLNGGSLAIIYCFTCLYLCTAGAGPWSVDAAMRRN